MLEGEAVCGRESERGVVVIERVRGRRKKVGEEGVIVVGLSDGKMNGLGEKGKGVGGGWGTSGKHGVS